MGLKNSISIKDMHTINILKMVRFIGFNSLSPILISGNAKAHNTSGRPIIRK
jgi:hypothetical protein